MLKGIILFQVILRSDPWSLQLIQKTDRFLKRKSLETWYAHRLDFDNKSLGHESRYEHVWRTVMDDANCCVSWRPAGLAESPLACNIPSNAKTAGVGVRLVFLGYGVIS